jgi:DNA-binding protein Fis
MKEAGGNLTKAALLVGLANYQTLKNWLGKYEVGG